MLVGLVELVTDERNDERLDAARAQRDQEQPGVEPRAVVVECREAAALLALGAPPRAEPAPADGILGEAVSALVNLGYKRAEAERAVEKVKRQAAPLEDVIRAALQGLAG